MAIAWTQYPPTEEDCERLVRYEDHRQLYKGAPAIDRLNGLLLNSSKMVRKWAKRLKKQGIIENYPRAISQISSALLFANPPVITVGDGQGKAQEVLNRLIRQNRLNAIFKESALSQSFRGDVLFRVRRGSLQGEPERTIIEEVPAYNYFADLVHCNTREVSAEHVAWQHDGKLFVQTHRIGSVENSAWEIGEQGKIGQRLLLQSAFGPLEAPPEYVETGLETTAVFHVPNERTCEEYYGDGDYCGLERVFDSINNRISRVDLVLDRHSMPKLVSLPGLIKPDGSLNLDDLEYMEPLQAELGKYLPRYVTWDGKLEASMAMIEHLLDTMCRVGRIAPAFFGLDKAGSIESGIAMRMRFFSTSSKIDDKKTYYDPVLKELLRAALDLEAEVLNEDLPGEISISWRAGLPTDDTEATANVVQRRGVGLISRETAIQRLDGVAPEVAAAEIARINAEELAAGQQSQAPAGNGGDLPAGSSGDRPPAGNGGDPPAGNSGDNTGA